MLLLTTSVNMFTGLYKLFSGHQSADKSVSPSLAQLSWAGAGLPGGAQPAATAAPPSLQNGAAAAPLQSTEAFPRYLATCAPDF